jgi:hypothetical protein
MNLMVAGGIKREICSSVRMAMLVCASELRVGRRPTATHPSFVGTVQKAGELSRS